MTPGPDGHKSPIRITGILFIFIPGETGAPIGRGYGTPVNELII